MGQRDLSVSASDLSTVLRIEQANLSGFPSFMTHFDGSWISRITPGSAAKRINSLNIYDPKDDENVELRLEQAQKRFAARGVPFHLRWTPLVPEAVEAEVNRQAWTSYGHTQVLVRNIWDLGETDVAQGYRLTHLSPADWLQAFTVTGGTPAAPPTPKSVAALGRALSQVMAECIYLAALDESGAPAAVLLGVLDGDCLGIYDVVTSPDHRRRSLASALMAEVQSLGAQKGADMAWLQVVGDNVPAVSLYESLGYREAYSYHYYRPAQA